MSLKGGTERSPALLSDREKAILAMLVEGSSNEDIGRRLNVATATVRNNMTVIRSKLDLHSRSKLREYAVAHGLVDGTERETRIGEVAD